MLADANGLVEAMKRAARNEREASKPVNVYFGEVVSKSPLKINVEQKMILGEAQLIMTRNVTDYVTMVTVNWESEKEKQKHRHDISAQTEEGDALNGKTAFQSETHTHIVNGQKQITIHNGLDVGDEVILIRQQEGQKYVVLDRIGI